MKLEFVATETGPKKWYAITDDGGNDGAGITPLDAVCDLVGQIENERRKAAATGRTETSHG